MSGSEQALGKYRLIAEIGRGGMADVYLAVVQGPAGFNKLVVIKKTRPELAQDPEFLTMFLDEARLAARLNHPNVVQTTEVGQDGERYFIAMEYLDGQPLNRVRSRAGTTFSVAMQVRVLADALAGLHHAHELCDFDGTPLAVVHRDATPQNIFVTYDGVIKVVDFGIAKAVDSSAETRTGVVKGKVTYMAPEQARGERVDRRADVFAAGVMLFEGVVGRRMWKGIPDLSVVHELLNGRIPTLRAAAPDAAEALLRICDRALAVRREDRFETALEMHDELLHYLDDAGGKTSAREVGKFVAERFVEDRAKVKAIIESQLRDVRWSGAYPKSTAVDLPKIDPGPLLITPTGSRADMAPRSGQTPTTGDLASSSVTNAASSLSAAPLPAKPARLVALVSVGAIASALVILVGVRFLGGSPQPPTRALDATSTVGAAPARDSAGEAPSVAPVPTQEAVKLTVRVSPATAKVYLDDALLSAGAFEGKLVKSVQSHRIRVEAQHHVAKEEMVTLSGDTMLSFALEKEAPGVPAKPVPRGKAPVAEPPPTAAPPAPTTPVAAPPPTAAPLAPGQKPKRTIETESPYAQ